MNLWRLTLHPSIDGEGGRLYSARWSTKGQPIVYLAESPPGALIEILVHLEIKEATIPPTYALLRVSVPDDLTIVDLAVPDSEAWTDDEDLTRSLGDVWLKAKGSALARVPSSILPDTFNYLLNPLHPDARRITIANARRAALDLRLIR
jgi:RES domain-containing protein